MKVKKPNQLLLERIQQLEIERSLNLIVLKEQLKLTGEVLKPINLLKGAFKSHESKTVILDSAIGFTTGLAAKKVVSGNSDNSLVKLLGSIVQVGVTSLVSKHPGIIKSIGSSIYKKIFSKKSAE
jgi:hypothetical protein